MNSLTLAYPIILALAVAGCEQTVLADPTKGALAFDAMMNENVADCAVMQEGELNVSRQVGLQKCSCAMAWLKEHFPPKDKDQLMTLAISQIARKGEAVTISPAQQAAMEHFEWAKDAARSQCSVFLR